MGVDMSYPNSYPTNMIGMYPVPPMAIPRYVAGGQYPQYSTQGLPQMQGQPTHPLQHQIPHLGDLPIPLQMGNGQSHDLSK